MYHDTPYYKKYINDDNRVDKLMEIVIAFKEYAKIPKKTWKKPIEAILWHTSDLGGNEEVEFEARLRELYTPKEILSEVSEHGEYARAPPLLAHGSHYHLRVVQ